MAPTTCQNCHQDNPLRATYCAYCGQALHQHRIDSHYIWHELQHGLLHVDKGILYTTKELLQRPGRMVRAFLGGQRTAHFKPVGFLIITVTVSALARQLLLHTTPSKDIAVPAGATPVVAALTGVANWLGHHPAFLALLLVLPLTAALYWAFRKATGINYFESFVLVLYLTGLAAVVRLLFVPVQLLLPNLPPVVTLRNLVTMGYMGLGFFQFYEVALPSPWRRLGRMTWALLLAALLLLVLLVVFGLLAVFVLKIPKYSPR